MHEQMTVTFISQLLDLASTIAIGGFGFWVYRKQKKVDKEFILDIDWKDNVDKKLEKNQEDIQDIRNTLNQNKAEDMARLRVLIVRELRRCIADGYRTQADIETIEPLLDIYFDDAHNGNGIVRQLARAYNNLELRVDRDLQ